MPGLTIAALIYLLLLFATEIIGCILTTRRDYKVKNPEAYFLITLVAVVLEIAATEQIALSSKPRFWFFALIFLIVLYISYVAYFLEWLEHKTPKHTARQATILIMSNVVCTGLVMWLAFALPRKGIRRAQPYEM